MDLKNYKTWIVIISLIVGGYAIGRYTVPSKIVTKTEVKTETQIVTKTVNVDKTDYYKNKILIEIITTKPDGTIIKQRKFIDKSTIIKDDESNTSSQTDTKSDSTTETTKTYSTQNGSVKGLFAKNLNNLNDNIYGIAIDKKLIGPFSVGAFGLTDKVLGVSLGINF